MVRKALNEVLKQAVSDPVIPWRDLSGASVLVTGCTGLVGSALVRVLAAANETYGLGLRMIGHGLNAAKGEALRAECGIEFVGSDIRRPIPTEAFPPTLDYIFHGASMTRSADMVSMPVDVIETAVKGTRNVLEAAVKWRCKSLVYLSSMEVYGQTNCAEVRENDLGYIDLSNPRSCYPESKRMCESLCAAFHKQYFLPAKIARLAQTFGAGTPKYDTRVFAQFARSAMSGSDIVLHTEGTSMGNYCDTMDVIRGLLLIALKGAAGGIYNVANPDASMTVRDMAKFVAKNICGGKVNVSVEIPADIQKRGYAADTGHVLNAGKLKALGWSPAYGLGDMYRNMIADWQEK